ncbi:hypothetical protein ACTFIR_004990 [Dictyostelium discoideum]
MKFDMYFKNCENHQQQINNNLKIIKINIIFNQVSFNYLKSLYLINNNKLPSNQSSKLTNSRKVDDNFIERNDFYQNYDQLVREEEEEEEENENFKNSMHCVLLHCINWNQDLVLPQFEFLVELSLIDSNISNIKAQLGNLKQLRYLNLTRNRLSTSDSLIGLREFKDLQYLILDQNPISTITHNTFSKLINLKVLSLIKTNLFCLIPTWIALRSNKNLIHLYFKEDDNYNYNNNDNNQNYNNQNNHDLFSTSKSIGFWKKSVLSTASSRILISSAGQLPIYLNNKYYREYFITMFVDNQLQSLDGKIIDEIERKYSKEIVNKNFIFPNKSEIPICRSPNQFREINKLLINCEIKDSFNNTNKHRNKLINKKILINSNFYNKNPIIKDIKTVRYPRQIEYHPNLDGILVVGSIDGFIEVLDLHSINDENNNNNNNNNSDYEGSFYSYLRNQLRSLSLNPQIPPSPSSTSLPLRKPPLFSSSINGNGNILGLSWIKESSNTKFLVGTENGIIQLIDFSKSKNESMLAQYPIYPRLTSLHSNCNSSSFITSGSNDFISIYDIERQSLIGNIKKAHTNKINVVKYSNSDPFQFVSSSLDGGIKKWDTRRPFSDGAIWSTSGYGKVVMTIYSPDDCKLLVSCYDNNISQLDSSDGRLLLKFDLPQTQKTYNYSRSYYNGDGSLALVGSCEENCVRIFDSKSGKTFRDILMINDDHDDYLNNSNCNGNNILSSLFPNSFNIKGVLSLRCDPFSNSFSMIKTGLSRLYNVTFQDDEEIFF